MNEWLGLEHSTCNKHSPENNQKQRQQDKDATNIRGRRRRAERTPARAECNAQNCAAYVWVCDARHARVEKAQRPATVYPLGMFCLDNATKFDDGMKIDGYADKQYQAGNWE